MSEKRMLHVNECLAVFKISLSVPSSLPSTAYAITSSRSGIPMAKATPRSLAILEMLLHCLRSHTSVKSNVSKFKRMAIRKYGAERFTAHSDVSPVLETIKTTKQK